MIDIKTVKISEKRQITLPSSLNFRKGAKALLINRGDEVVIRPVSEANEAAILSEKALTECWDSKEDEEAFAYFQ